MIICIEQLKISELFQFKVKFRFILFFLVFDKNRYTCKCNFKHEKYTKMVLYDMFPLVVRVIQYTRDFSLTKSR